MVLSFETWSVFFWFSEQSCLLCERRTSQRWRRPRTYILLRPLQVRSNHQDDDLYGGQGNKVNLLTSNELKFLSDKFLVFRTKLPTVWATQFTAAATASYILPRPPQVRSNHQDDDLYGGQGNEVDLLPSNELRLLSDNVVTPTWR